MYEELKSNFSPYIQRLVQYKQSLGYKFDTGKRILKSFDTFCWNHFPNKYKLDEEIMLQWASRRDNEKSKTLSNRIHVINQLSKFILSEGGESYIIPSYYIPKRTRYIPYIFGDEEVTRIFNAIDNNCHYCSEVPNRQYVMPLFFRTLYCCGLRVTEARLMRVCDVDLENGVITLLFTKNGKERQIPLSETLHQRFKEYAKKVLITSSPMSPFFPGYRGEPMTIGNIEKNFRKFLWQARISHHGRTKEGEQGSPCVHSWRHTFAVKCIRKWYKEGKDINAYLPVLQSYMGHSSYSDTAYYLHFTSDFNSDLTERLENLFGNIIPGLHAKMED